MTRLQQIVATGALAAFMGSAAGAEPTTNGLHLNGLHLNGWRLNGLRLNGLRVDAPADKSLTFNEIVSGARGSPIPGKLRALAAAPMAD
jgi:hypothetical protein